MLRSPGQCNGSKLHTEGPGHSTSYVRASTVAYCSSHCIRLTPAFLPGLANLGAGALSRNKETQEWCLSRSVVQRISQCFGTPSIDLFVSRGSAQVLGYYSLDRTDSRAAPPQLIPLFLRRLKGNSGKVILITTFWVRAAWFPELVLLSVQPPRRLPTETDVVKDTQSGKSVNRPQEVETDCIVHLRNRFETEGTVEPLAEFLCGCLWSSTREQYRYAWKAWCGSCD